MNQTHSMDTAGSLATPNEELASAISERLSALLRTPSNHLVERIASGQMTPDEWQNLLCVEFEAPVTE